MNQKFCLLLRLKYSRNSFFKINKSRQCVHKRFWLKVWASGTRSSQTNYDECESFLTVRLICMTAAATAAVHNGCRHRCCRCYLFCWHQCVKCEETFLWGCHQSVNGSLFVRSTLYAQSILITLSVSMIIASCLFVVIEVLQ